MTRQTLLLIDINSGHWAYCDITEASDEHEYTRKDDGSEVWQ